MSEWGFAFTKWSDSAVAEAVVKMQCRQANLLSSEVFCCVCVCDSVYSTMIVPIFLFGHWSILFIKFGLYFHHKPIDDV